ncbi:MAG: hypothetical protein V9H69_20235 [Anaerolineae bacterium]
MAGSAVRAARNGVGLERRRHGRHQPREQPQQVEVSHQLLHLSRRRHPRQLHCPRPLTQQKKASDGRQQYQQIGQTVVFFALHGTCLIDPSVL